MRISSTLHSAWGERHPAAAPLLLNNIQFTQPRAPVHSSVPELSPIQNALLLAAIAAVAFLYSSVGHGGATGYLAVAALLGLAPAVARPGALWMNCVVAGIAFWRFQRAGSSTGKYSGGSRRHQFLRVARAAGCIWTDARITSAGRGVAGGGLVSWHGQARRTGEPPGTLIGPWLWLPGRGLGLLAGITGIGGGVFLTPLLIFLNWAPAKVAGGISALFILVNSVGRPGRSGRRGLVWQPVFVLAVVMGVAGALLGTWLGVNRWRTLTFRRALAGVLWIAAGN